MTNELELRIVLKASTGFRLFLEPWGEEYEIEKSESVTLNFLGPPPPTVALELDPNGLGVWGWTGSTVDASLSDGRRLGPGDAKRFRVPRTP